jgi:hypothetical protein
VYPVPEAQPIELAVAEQPCRPAIANSRNHPQPSVVLAQVLDPPDDRVGFMLPQ